MQDYELSRLFYTTIINANERESAYALDGLIYHDIKRSSMHSTDGFGDSEVVFSLAYSPGFSFAP